MAPLLPRPSFAAVLLPLFLLAATHFPSCSRAAKSLYDLAAVDIDGNLVSLHKYKGTVSLVVNVASFCGLTKSNYQELVSLERQLSSTGKFQVLAFPCNQFNSQEPKSNSEVKAFARDLYGASFPMFAKATVNRPVCEGNAGACASSSVECCPTNNIVYSFLLRATGEKPIEWNFEKFFVDDQGVVVKRYSPQTSPLSILPDIQAALSKLNGEVSEEGTIKYEDPRADTL